jgi:hypothetical protein
MNEWGSMVETCWNWNEFAKLRHVLDSSLRWFQELSPNEAPSSFTSGDPISGAQNGWSWASWKVVSTWMWKSYCRRGALRVWEPWWFMMVYDGLWWFVSRYPPVNEHSYEIHGFPVRPFFLPNGGFSRSLLVKGGYLLFAVCFLYTKPQVYSATIWVYPKRCGRCQLCLGSVRCFLGWGPREYLAGEVQCYLVGVRRPSDGGFWCSCLLIGVY